jgi:hypothetical protein
LMLYNIGPFLLILLNSIEFISAKNQLFSAW